jgi:hypothetical protein
MDRRRSVRQFSTDPVRHELIADAHPLRGHRAVGRSLDEISVWV